MLSLQAWTPAFGESSNFYDGLGVITGEDDDALLGVNPAALDRPRAAEGVVKMKDIDMTGAATGEVFEANLQAFFKDEQTEDNGEAAYPEELLPPTAITVAEPAPAKQPTKKRASTRKAKQTMASAKRPRTTSPQDDGPQSKKNDSSVRLASPLSKSGSSPSTNVKGDETKRDKFLERNRIAASKCRQKRKEWMHNLEERKQEVENMHWHLQNEYHLLVAEVSKLKNMLMEHAHCQDENVQRWIDSEARRIVHSSDGVSEERRESSAGSVGAGFSFDEMRRDSLAQQSSATSWETPPEKEEEINYDHMPDAMFLDDTL